ncbi:hypothetical protein [Paenibacillus gallinarum]|uniref:Uncharacterized protein n=1 Tax=Paenibacillus gallinarum TaxID=2762232 RepID=A0ABR8SYI5_9BACL|nr:hypothetical protein [Paenibacillus gallinarum]MBD7968576.1 hypothetical protein [Paenibacillus gallinarum]
MAIFKRNKRVSWIITIVLLSGILFFFILFLNDVPGGFSDRRVSKALGMTSTLKIPLGKTPEEAVQKFRGNDSPNRVIYQETVEEGVLIFMNRPEKEDTSNLQVEFVRKARFGWKWVWGGGFGTSRANAALIYMSMAGLDDIPTPFPLIFGNVLDPSIKSITAETKESGVIKAKLIPIDPDKTIWFVLIPSAVVPPIEIKGFNQEGGLVADGIINDFDDSNNIELIR